MVASGGFHNSNNGYHLEFTVGETSVTSYEESGYFLTQGFQQPSMIYEFDPYREDKGTNISVYPNPVENDLVIKLQIEEKTKFTVEVYTFTGISLFKKKLSELQKGSNYFTIDFTGHSPGIYMIHVYSPDKEINRLCKVEKF